MTRYTKIAVTVPTATYDAVETIRKRLGTTRSATVALALEAWLEHHATSELDRRYAEGYRRFPENLEQIEAVAVLATSHWDPWPADEASSAADATPKRRRRAGASR